MKDRLRIKLDYIYAPRACQKILSTPKTLSAIISVKGGDIMSKRFFVIWSIVYLIIMAILIIGFGRVKSWFDLFTGFVIGVTVWSLLIIYRDRKTRNLSDSIRKSLRRFVDRVGKKNFALIFSLIFCSPIIIWCFYSHGWQGLAASICGFIVGQFLCNRFIKY